MGNGDATGCDALGNDALVAVATKILARHGPIVDEICQDVRHVFTALPPPAVDEAYLAAAKPGWCDGPRAGERGGGRLRQHR